MHEAICSFPQCGAPVIETRAISVRWLTPDLCSGHYGQKHRGQPLRPILRGLTVADRFWMKVDKDGPLPQHRPELGPCWIWTGAVGGHTYGNFSAYGRTWRAHQWSYVHEVGPVPNGLMLDHLCRVHLCVRTTHLEPVTPAENVRRGDAPELTRERNRNDDRCGAGHLLTDDNTYVQPKTGYRYCRMCQRRRRAEFRERQRVAA